MRELFRQLDERLALRSPVDVYLAGGMAVHLYTASRVTTDVDARKALYADIFKKGHDLNYTVPLFNLQDIYGMSERMEWQPRTDAKLLIKEMSVAE